MPFVFTWTNTDPADPTPANLLGKDIRDLRAAIQERMDDQFCDPVGPWSASDPTHPIVVAPKILGNVANKTITIHHSNFKIVSNIANAPLTYTDLYIQNTASTFSGGAAVVLQTGIPMPVGVIITGVSMLVDPRQGGSITGTLSWNDYTAGAPINHSAAVIASGGGAGVAIAGQAANLVVTTAMTILFNVVINVGNFNVDGNRFYGIRVTYGTPDCRNTY